MNVSDPRDAIRLLYLTNLLDCVGSIDIHERAGEIAAGGDAGDAEYLQAIREAIDAAIKEDAA
jgi:hypothetical protein